MWIALRPARPCGPLVPQGEAIAALAAAVTIDTRTEPPADILKVLRGVVSSAGAAPASFFSFEVERPGARSTIKGIRALATSISAAPARKIHMAVAKLPDDAKGKAPPKVPRLLAVVAHEQDGKLVFRQLFSR
jgi:hypothetical protein